LVNLVVGKLSALQNKPWGALPGVLAAQLSLPSQSVISSVGPFPLAEA